MAAQARIEADISTAERRRKPYKIRCFRGRFKGIVVSSLNELKLKACEKLELRPSEDIRVCLHEDGTEIDEEEYFQFLPQQTKFIVSTATDRFSAEMDDDMSSLERSESQVVNARDVVDAGMILEPRLKARLSMDPTFFVSLSDEELEKVISLDPEKASIELKKTQDEVLVYQEFCEHELKRRSDLRDATELLKLYKKAVGKDATE
eukprot:gene15439-17015_t